MTNYSWDRQTDGRYVIDTIIGDVSVRTMVDTGLVDPFGTVAFELQPSVFDRLLAAGQLVNLRLRIRLDSSGKKSELRTARTLAGLASPDDPTKLVTLPFQVYVARGSEKAPNRVGVAFFHQLPGCRVEWDCATRRWVIQLP